MEIHYNIKKGDWSIRLSDEDMAELFFALDMASIHTRSNEQRAKSNAIRNQIKEGMEQKR